jgi:DNA-binding transcriptional MerR regulator
MNTENKLTVGQLSQQTGISIRTLHYYEEQGLLHPVREGEGEHRKYDAEQIKRLQQIASLKFLGFSLKEIDGIVKDALTDGQWQELLKRMEDELIRKKEGLELALKAIGRLQGLPSLSEPEQLDSLISLVRGIQTERNQRSWLEKERGHEAVVAVFDRQPEELKAMDALYLSFVRVIKEKAGGPVDTPEVQQLIQQYMDAQMALVGEEAIKQIGNPDDLDIAELELLTAQVSPFTSEEEKWLSAAIEFVMIKRIAEENNIS